MSTDEAHGAPFVTDAEIDAARERGRLAAQTEPRAATARYDAARGEMTLELTNGCRFTFRPRALQGLSEATDADLSAVEVTPSGHGLHWEALDADFTVPGLMMGLFGTRAWVREQAGRAGRATSPAKAAAARANGAKGGRPKGAHRRQPV